MREKLYSAFAMTILALRHTRSQSSCDNVILNCRSCASHHSSNHHRKGVMLIESSQIQPSLQHLSGGMMLRRRNNPNQKGCRKIWRFGFRAFASAYFEVHMNKIREYIGSKGVRHAHKLRI